MYRSTIERFCNLSFHHISKAVWIALCPWNLFSKLWLKGESLSSGHMFLVGPLHYFLQNSTRRKLRLALMHPGEKLNPTLSFRVLCWRKTRPLSLEQLYWKSSSLTTSKKLPGKVFTIPYTFNLIWEMMFLHERRLSFT